MRSIESSRVMIFLERLIDKRECRWPEDEIPVPFYEKFFLMQKDQKKEEEQQRQIELKFKDKRKLNETPYKPPKNAACYGRKQLPFNYGDLQNDKTASNNRKFKTIAVWKQQLRQSSKHHKSKDRSDMANGGDKVLSETSKRASNLIKTTFGKERRFSDVS